MEQTSREQTFQSELEQVAAEKEYKQKRIKNSMQYFLISVHFGNNVLVKNVIVFVNKPLNYNGNMMNNHVHFLINLKQQQHKIVNISRYLTEIFL